MADTTTTNLGLTKPEVGASADTWGTKLNTDLDSIDALFAAAGTGTSVGLNVGAGKTIAVAGTLNVTGSVSGGVIATLASPTFTGTVTLPSTTSIGNVSSTEIGYLDGVTSAIQSQLNAKEPAIVTLGVNKGGTGSSSLTANNVLLGNGTSALQTVAPGTSGNVLTSDGTTWQSAAPAGGGSLVLLQSVVASNSATVTLNAFSATYDNYVIVVDGCRPATNSTDLIMQFNTRTSSYLWVYQSMNSSSMAATIAQDGSQSTNGFVIAPAANNNAASAVSSMIEIMSSRTAAAIASWRSNYQMPTTFHNRLILGGGNNQNITSVGQVVFLMSSGNISAGNFRLYGIKKA